MVSLAVLSTIIASAAALGINCRGSGACNVNSGSLKEVLTQVKQIQAGGNGGHNFASGGIYIFSLFSNVIANPAN